MQTTETLQQFEELTKRYLEELQPFSLEQLRRQPNEEDWSLGQTYLHLVKTALYMQLGNVEKCRIQSIDGAAAASEKTEAGEAIFALGGFPPERIRVPSSPLYTPEQPESKEQIIEGMQAVLQKMKEIAPALEAISPAHVVMHPRLGGLNAKEWFALVEMHYRHHLLQLERLKSFLNHTEMAG
ncbi:DinB family protein [Paenibacillus sp. SI8]|uniref:DinB family protein n=1 Tax=unclassified Paenibacillus TaxID=185978 RepID=UPI0034673CD3